MLFCIKKRPRCRPSGRPRPRCRSHAGGGMRKSPPGFAFGPFGRYWSNWAVHGHTLSARRAMMDRLSYEAEMTSFVRRRDFLTLLAGAAAISPPQARAQQQANPVIGFLNSTSPDPSLQRVAAFRRGLNDLGYGQPRNLAIEFRWAGYQSYDLPRLAADLVRRQVAVIAAAGSTAAAQAAKRATSTIPIVFEIGGDPVVAGLVDSPNGSPGNLTGISLNVDALAR